MAFATWPDYKAALRHHRSWPATIALFLLAGLSGLVAAALLSIAFGVGNPALVIALPLLVGLALTWADAAQLAAARRRSLSL